MKNNNDTLNKNSQLEQSAYTYMMQLTYIHPALKNIKAPVPSKKELKVFDGHDIEKTYIAGIKLGEEQTFRWIINYLKEYYDISDDFIKKMVQDSEIDYFSTSEMLKWMK